MDKRQTFLSGMGIGAAIMYVLDPYWGRRRRALARDKVIRALRKMDSAIGVTTRDLSNRTYGLFAGIRSQFTPDGEHVSDDVLIARVRSKMGRVVSHPGSIEVTAQQGRIALRGPILSREVGRLLRAVASVRGVKEVDNQLDVHENADDMPGLQGGGKRPGHNSEFAQTFWSPSARLLAGLAGGALTAYGVLREDNLGVGASLAGLGLVARAATNMEIKRIVGVGAGRRAVDIQKTIHINAPVEEVFAFWDNFANFPHFMRNVRKVTKGNAHSHWVVNGPAGMPIEWQAEVTSRIPNQVLAWKTLPGSPVAHAGIVRFFPENEGTRVDIKMSYNPVAGAVGHVIASMFGANPKKEMDEDMVRMKTMIETGKVPHDASRAPEE